MLSIRATKSSTEPLAPQPKQWKTRRSRWIEQDGLVVRVKGAQRHALRSGAKELDAVAVEDLLE